MSIRKHLLCYPQPVELHFLSSFLVGLYVPGWFVCRFCGYKLINSDHDNVGNRASPSVSACGGAV